ncbi:MurR/RpiR family transcriptional regulator [Shimazuella alba]|uniref:SIS domain-containing protein n=1 Tax=Shimazuella alba TaxID=2690964 RepID=A0A6I4VQ11_9BACL|nr:MurR/RpiR family transcriptional regulator [Shimazuella alba]MXQ52471.1 SIS domain-containing protein [Shimazuella alba]
MDMSVEFNTKIFSYMNTLTKAEKKVADYVLDNMENTIYLTVTELAAKVGVGETTVLRFCRRIGYKGYQAFKMAITKEVAKQSFDTSEETDEMNAVQSLVQKSTTASIQALKDTSQLIDMEMLEKAVALLTSQKRIVMYGASMSGNTAEDARNRFLRIGVIIEVYTDAHMQAMSAATLTKDDLAIGISISGSTKDTIDALRIAKSNGAKVISLTHSKLSPITHLSDVILLTAGRETPLQGGSMGAKISQLLVIDLLYNLVANQRKNEASRLKELTSKAVLDKAY